MTQPNIKDDNIKKVALVLNLIPKYRSIKKAHRKMGF